MTLKLGVFFNMTAGQPKVPVKQNLKLRLKHLSRPNFETSFDLVFLGTRMLCIQFLKMKDIWCVFKTSKAVAL